MQVVSESSGAKRGRSQRPTMREVATLAGVAVKTVSRVVNGVPTVDAELARRVREAAQSLGYRPNVAASNLRRSDGRTQTIGLLLADVGNPFSASIHRAVEDVARERGVLILTGSLNEDGRREVQLARALIDRRVDGLIISPSNIDYGWMRAELAAGTVCTFVDRVPELLVADAVVGDSYAGSWEAVQHLMSTGHRRIAFLSDDLTIQTGRDRLRGYCDALSAAGIDRDENLVRTGLRSAAAAREATLELLELARPTAIFAAQNLISIGVIGALHSLGLEHTIAMIGFDDLVMAEVLTPTVSIVDQDAALLGRTAAKRLFARLDGDTSPPTVYRLPTRLIIRESSAIVPTATADLTV